MEYSTRVSPCCLYTPTIVAERAFPADSEFENIYFFVRIRDLDIVGSWQEYHSKYDDAFSSILKRDEYNILKEILSTFRFSE